MGRFPQPVREALRTAVLAADSRQKRRLAPRHQVEVALQFRVDRNLQVILVLRFHGRDVNRAVLHMLLADAHNVRPSEAGVKQ